MKICVLHTKHFLSKSKQRKDSPLKTESTYSEQKETPFYFWQIEREVKEDKKFSSSRLSKKAISLFKIFSWFGTETSQFHPSCYFLLTEVNQYRLPLCIAENANFGSFSKLLIEVAESQIIPQIHAKFPGVGVRRVFGYLYNLLTKPIPPGGDIDKVTKSELFMCNSFVTLQQKSTRQ